MTWSFCLHQAKDNNNVLTLPEVVEHTSRRGGCGGGSAGCPLIRRLVVRSPALPVFQPSSLGQVTEPQIAPEGCAIGYECV